MKISISGLKKVYTSGDFVDCHVDILRKNSLFKSDNSEIISIDISLTKRLQTDTRTGYGIGTATDMNGNTYTYTYPIYKYDYNDIVVCRDMNGTRALDKHEYRKNLKFKIPDDASNSSSLISESGDYQKHTKYGVLVKVKVLQNGEENELEKFSLFDNRMIIPDHDCDDCVYFESTSDLSILLKSNTSTYTPGQVLILKAVVMNKGVTSFSSLKMSFKTETYGRVQSQRILAETNNMSKRMSFKVVPRKSFVSVQQEHDYLKHHLDLNSKCMKFVFKLSENMCGEVDRKIFIDSTIRSTYGFCGITYHNARFRVFEPTNDVLKSVVEVGEIDDEEEKEIEASDPTMGLFPDVPLTTRRMQMFLEEEKERHILNELIRQRNRIRKERMGVTSENVSETKENKDEDGNNYPPSLPFLENKGISETKEEKEEDGYNYPPRPPILENKDIPIFYRFLIHMNDSRKTMLSMINERM